MSVLSPSLSCVIPLVLIVSMFVINTMKLTCACECDYGVDFDCGYKVHSLYLRECCYHSDYDYCCGCDLMMIIMISLIMVSIAISLRFI